MRNLIILLAVALLLYLLVKWFTKTPPKQVVIAAKKYALYAVGAVLLLLVVSGRMHWLYGVVAGLIPLGQRLFTAWRTINYFRNFTSSKQNHSNPDNTTSANQASTIQTSFLNMTLDHDSGEMNGTVNKGKFANQQLNQLNLDQLLELLSECYTVNGSDSVAVLESYLDRYYGACDDSTSNNRTGDSDSDQEKRTSSNWRDQYTNHSSDKTQTIPEENDMTIQQAYLILGLTENVGIKEIKEAHRRLMQRFHPDRGGSTYLSVKINQAKDFLMKDRKN